MDYFGQVNAAGEPHGIGRMCLHKKGIIEGQWVNAEASGFGRKINKEGDDYQGKFVDGKPNG